MPRVQRVVTRIVDAGGAISYDANVYELPRGYRGRELTIRDDGRLLRVFAGASLVYEHALLLGRGQRARRRDVAIAIAERSVVIDVARRPLDVYEELVG